MKTLITIGLSLLILTGCSANQKKIAGLGIGVAALAGSAVLVEYAKAKRRQKQNQEYQELINRPNTQVLMIAPAYNPSGAMAPVSPLPPVRFPTVINTPTGFQVGYQ